MFKLPQPPHNKHRVRKNLETVACGAKSGVFLRYCNWNGSVTVLTENRWQSKALAAGMLYLTDAIIQCVTSCPTHHGGLRHIRALRHRIRPDEWAT